MRMCWPSGRGQGPASAFGGAISWTSAASSRATHRAKMAALRSASMSLGPSDVPLRKRCPSVSSDPNGRGLPGGVVKRNRSELHPSQDFGDLRHDRNRDFRWASGADVEPDRRVNPRLFVRSESFGPSALDPLGMGSGRPEAAEIETSPTAEPMRLPDRQVLGHGSG